MSNYNQNNNVLTNNRYNINSKSKLTESNNINSNVINNSNHLSSDMNDNKTPVVKQSK